MAYVRANWRRVFLKFSQQQADARPDDWAPVFEHEWRKP